MITSSEKKWLKASFEMSKIFAACLKRNYFCFIIASNNRLIGQGYNGSPPGYPNCTDGACPRSQANSPGGSVYDNCIANHAEANALLWSDPHHRINSTLIINGSPCFGCAKLIASSGISRVVGVSDASYSQQDFVETFLRDNGVDVVLVDSSQIL